MRAVHYTPEAARDLKRHGNVAGRIRAALGDYAANPAAHANKVRALRGSAAKRLRIGDFRAIFEETEAALIVTKIGPRGSVYD